MSGMTTSHMVDKIYSKTPTKLFNLTFAHCHSGRTTERIQSNSGLKKSGNLCQWRRRVRTFCSNDKASILEHYAHCWQSARQVNTSDRSAQQKVSELYWCSALLSLLPFEVSKYQLVGVTHLHAPCLQIDFTQMCVGARTVQVSENIY